MSDEELKALFRTVADHLESLAISIQNVEDLQEQDRTRMEADRVRMEADHARLDRLERLFKLMVRIGDRERKDLRERINALIDAHIRSETKVERLSGQMELLGQKMQELSESQMRTDTKIEILSEKMQELSVASTQFQAQVGVALTKLADATALAHQRLDAVESKG